MTPVTLLIELTCLAGLATACYGLALYVRERPGGGSCGDAPGAGGQPTGAAAEGTEQCSSVQRSPRGRLFGVPNTVLGIAYYLAVMGAFALPDSGAAQLARGAAALASLAAAAMSVFLLWSLMAITRRACRVCLAGNSINLFLCGLVLASVVGRWCTTSN